MKKNYKSIFGFAIGCIGFLQILSATVEIGFYQQEILSKLSINTPIALAKNRITLPADSLIGFYGKYLELIYNVGEKSFAGAVIGYGTLDFQGRTAVHAMPYIAAKVGYVHEIEKGLGIQIGLLGTMMKNVQQNFSQNSSLNQQSYSQFIFIGEIGPKFEIKDDKIFAKILLNLAYHNGSPGLGVSCAMSYRTS